MHKRSLGLTIFLWCEIIIAVRILMFSIPALINRNLEKIFSTANIADWFLLNLSFLALYYVMIGFVSLAGFKLWKIFHYAACLLTLILTWSLMKLIAAQGQILSTGYLIPAAVSVLIAVYIASVKPRVA